MSGFEGLVLEADKLMKRLEVGMEEKKKKLISLLESYGSAAVALSGGVDSMTLARAAYMALGDRAVAVTAASELLSEEERRDARAGAEAVGIRHVILEADDLALQEIRRNDRERCYFCKRHRMEKMLSWAKQAGLAVVADGSNVSDRSDYRPGARALQELGIRSPLAECGFNKEDIRKLAKEWGLAVWDKPSAACLASRVAYGLELTPERLQRIDMAETFLRELGVKGQLRVRDHGDLARIEVAEEAFGLVAEQRAGIAGRLKALGFAYVTLDMTGYRMGSQNISLP